MLVADQYQTDRLLIGLPKSMSGEIGPQAQRVQEFAAQLVEDGLKVRYWDERLTTVSAHRALIEGDLSRKKRKQVVDKVAAVYILQGFLDAGGWKD